MIHNLLKHGCVKAKQWLIQAINAAIYSALSHPFQHVSFLLLSPSLHLFSCLCIHFSTLSVLSHFISSPVPPRCPLPFFFASPPLPFPLQCSPAAASYLSFLSSPYLHSSRWVATELAQLHILALRASWTTSLFHRRTEQLQSNG